jgi:glutathione peroxidase
MRNKNTVRLTTRNISSGKNSAGYGIAAYHSKLLIQIKPSPARRFGLMARTGTVRLHFHTGQTMYAFSMPPWLLALIAGAAMTSPKTWAASPETIAAAAPAVCPALLQQEVLRLQDEKPQSLCQYSGKVVVVVNTASFCGFTPQYEGLEALHAKYQDRGLVVLGFPSNDFSQETGSNKQIADFCQNTFGVKFPMFTKTRVTGRDASPLFRQLAAKTGTAPRWNFYKYIISRDGAAVTSFNSMTEPGSRGFVAEIEKQLASP